MPSLRIIYGRLFPKIFGTTKDRTLEYAKYKSSTSGVKGGLASNQDSSWHPDSIIYTKTFAVEHGDNDETSLVKMAELTPKSLQARSSNTSDISL
jgi:hypothetical protein